MPRKKKEMLTEKELSKMREVDAYERKAHERYKQSKGRYVSYDRVN